MMGNKIKELLEELKQINLADSDNDQGIVRPEKMVDFILTLDGNKKPLSPMLKERFEYVSTWNDAFLLQNWLSLSEINNFADNPELMENINLRLENWEHVPPASVGLSKVSIFGFDPYDTNETYLEWGDGEIEPKIWLYFDSNYHMFKNLERFLLYAVNQLDEDDLKS